MPGGDRGDTDATARYGLRGTVPALERAEEPCAAITGRPVGQTIEGRLHEFVDGVQRDLPLLAGKIGTAFFRDWRPRVPVVAEVLLSQAQDGTGQVQVQRA